MKCTWVNCNNNGSFSEKDKNNKEWAFLCKEHHDMLEKSIEEFIKSDDNNPKKMLACWVKANGGANSMTNKMIKEDLK